MKTTRRQFLSVSAAGATALLNPFENLAMPVRVKAAPGFSLTMLATNWGFSGTWDDYCSKVKVEGYDGIEVWWQSNADERKKLFEALTKHNLKFGFLWGSAESGFEKHEELFRRGIEEIVTTKPMFINCHSGKDFFSVEEKLRLISFTTEQVRKNGIPIYHETHRSRACYSAPVTRELIEKSPALRLTFDVSHWCNVHESLLQDQAETIDLAIGRTDHIHARIGHAEGPQVNDPRAPEWDAAVKAHMAWWDRIVEIKKKEGKALTILSEFGPADYMPTIPYTRQPLADQWAINAYMMKTLRKRYLG